MLETFFISVTQIIMVARHKGHWKTSSTTLPTPMLFVEDQPLPKQGLYCNKTLWTFLVAAQMPNNTSQMHLFPLTIYWIVCTIILRCGYPSMVLKYNPSPAIDCHTEDKNQWTECDMCGTTKAKHPIRWWQYKLNEFYTHLKTRVVLWS